MRVTGHESDEVTGTQEIIAYPKDVTGYRKIDNGGLRC